MKELFVDTKFKPESLRIIVMAETIIDEYAKQGYSLTLRQLYYQFVARALIPNTERSYKRIGNIINKARLAGLIDWIAIEDRTRNLQKNNHYESPAYAMRLVRDVYRNDLWANQPERVEVWIEKEALVGVISDTCRELDVPYFACRGYVSQSEQWRAGLRFRSDNQGIIVLHLGDHDPSGIDMTRDNDDRLNMFSWSNVEVVRIALNMDQVHEYSPPPNPAKMTDSRFDEYAERYGTESWELDALEPSVINELIREHIAQYRDEDLWDEAVAEQELGRSLITDAIDRLE